jgi:hypothetical protein
MQMDDGRRDGPRPACQDAITGQKRFRPGHIGGVRMIDEGDGIHAVTSIHKLSFWGSRNRMRRRAMRSSQGLS